MKKFAIATLALLAASAQASAYTSYKCTTQLTNQTYLLKADFLSGDAKIFVQSEESPERWKPLFENARAAMAMDGGPAFVTGSDESEVDWALESNCFLFRPIYRFYLKLSSRGTTGTLEVLPKVVVNPAVLGCPLPHVVPAPAQELTCVTL